MLVRLRGRGDWREVAWLGDWGEAFLGDWMEVAWLGDWRDLARLDDWREVS